MKRQKKIRLFNCFLLMVLLICFLTLPALAEDGGTAAGDVSGAIEGIWQNVSGQMKTICNNVVFPALAVVCGIGFVISLVICIFNYKKHHSVEVGWPIALLIGLIVALTAPSWVWVLVGA